MDCSCFGNILSKLAFNFRWRQAIASKRVANTHATRTIPRLLKIRRSRQEPDFRSNWLASPMTGLGSGGRKLVKFNSLGSIGLFSDAARVARCALRRESRPRRYRAEFPSNPNMEKARRS